MKYTQDQLKKIAKKILELDFQEAEINEVFQDYVISKLSEDLLSKIEVKDDFGKDLVLIKDKKAFYDLIDEVDELYNSYVDQAYEKDVTDLNKMRAFFFKNQESEEQKQARKRLRKRKEEKNN